MPVNLPCSLYHGATSTPIQTTVLDVSFGGMGVVTTKELGTGDVVEVHHNDFPCPPAKTPSSKCRVISVRSAKGNPGGFRTGMAFENPDLHFIQNLLEWVQAQTLVQKMFHQRAAATDARLVQPKNTIERLEKEIDTLRSLIPICCACKKVRNDKGYWEQIEAYVKNGAGAEFSHSIGPACREKLYPGLAAKK